MNILAELGLIFCLVVTGCRLAPGTEGNRVVSDGRSSSLAVRPGLPLCNIERIGDTAFPFSVPQPIAVAATSNLVVSGFAADRDKKAPAGGVDVVIDGIPYASEYGLPRDDVREYFKVSAYKDVGFSFSRPAISFPPGPHRILIRVIAGDKKSYQESPAVLVMLR